MWEKFLLAIGMKIVDRLVKKGFISIDKEQTRKNIKEEVSRIVSGNPPPENIEEILLFANNQLGPFDDDVVSLRRMASNYQQSVARKSGARKTTSAKKKVAAKKKPVAKKRAA
jgi:hypothetical protein